MNQFFLLYSLGIFILTVVILILFLNRNPKRKIPEGDNIVSPADGEVIEILDLSKLEDKPFIIKKGTRGKILTSAEEIGTDSYLISIYLRLYNVHIQRAPMAGKVMKIKYEKGKNRVAGNINAFENEKNEIIIKNKDKIIKVIQIAGLIFRRIICDVKRKDVLKKGQKFGRILIGSQVSIIIGIILASPFLFFSNALTISTS